MLEHDSLYLDWAGGRFGTQCSFHDVGSGSIEDYQVAFQQRGCCSDTRLKKGDEQQLMNNIISWIIIMRFNI